MTIETSRRNFLRGLAGTSLMTAGGCLYPSVSTVVPVVPASRRVRLAAVGLMGKGLTDWLPMVKSGKAELVAICDVDRAMLAKAINHEYVKAVPGLSEKLAKLPFFTDYRQLLDRAGVLGVQAMTVATPDHAHAAIAIQAMKQGIHVFVEKPLVRTLWELDYFRRTAKEHGVITQLGNQGSGVDGLRRGVDILRSGVLGDVREVHVWTNRPVWPQGFAAAQAVTGAADAIPEGFDWNAWLGCAKDRPFKGAYPNGKKGYDPWNLCANVYHPFSWRGFLDFGAGAYGDMACHTMNLPFRGLELGSIQSAECTFVEERNDLTFPMKSTVKLIYPARPSACRAGVTLPEVTLTWYDGGQLPSAELMPQVVATLGKVPDEGMFLVGSKGVMLSTSAYGGFSSIALTGEEKIVDIWKHEAVRDLAQKTPYRSEASGGTTKGDGAAAVEVDGHYTEFLDAINGEGVVYADTHSRCYADVEFTIPLMEGILCGVIAQQVPGVLAWDSARQTFDKSAANALLKPYIRRGFEF